MKHGRRLTREEKMFLSRQKFNHKDYLRVSKSAEGYVFVHRMTGKLLEIRR